jgi:hypothetical protein
LLSATFSGQNTISTEVEWAQSVFAADVDGDGDLDVLSASFHDDTIAWYENSGSQSFTAHTIDPNIDVAPDPRTGGVGLVTNQYSEDVTGVDIFDFSLTRDIEGDGLGPLPVSLTGLPVGSTGSVGFFPETEPNDSIDLALNIDAALWNVNPNSNFGDLFGMDTSTTVPHITIGGTGDDTFDYYSFTIANSGDTAIFDIDGATFNTELFLYDPLTGKLLAENDDSTPTNGAGGSFSPFDSYIEYIFDEPGTYVLGVGRFNSEGDPGGITGDPIRLDSIYYLRVSIEYHPLGIVGGDTATLSIDDVSLAEGDSGETDFTFTISIAETITSDVNVDFATADDLASAPDDYTAISGTATITAGATSTTVTVKVQGDAAFEPDETFFVNLSNPVNAVIVDSQGLGTITDDDTVISSQIVAPSPTSQTAFVGDSFSFDVIYTTDPLDETLPGLGLRLHFDSTKVQFDGLTNVLQTNLFLSESTSDDTENFDADPATDMFVSVAWTDIGGSWPGVGNLPATLYTANFTALVVGTATTMNFSDSDTAGGFVLDATSAEVMITINLDVDANGEATALTDGVLIVRYLFGVTGTQLTDGLLGTGALRTDPVEIITFLDGFLPAAASASLVVSTQDVLIANYEPTVSVGIPGNFETGPNFAKGTFNEESTTNVVTTTGEVVLSPINLAPLLYPVLTEEEPDDETLTEEAPVIASEEQAELDILFRDLGGSLHDELLDV